ncbi:unnamed protein product [Kuraishia capsulata CBS 1993]|uniref:Uncharacterized protein n=1 Tax=Kuraishia capsulata CBS 1993 TaxID=1382522 RepID=W6MGE3_9ASCO|nr:uncharacterized protein KUCA_T00001116001 [Kuraishia capsulata CBS 1993]CDK25149.1 unnamed protein product [Kuraishia capsulata CBS 1993]
MIMYASSLVSAEPILPQIDWYGQSLWGAILTYSLVLVRFYLLGVLADEETLSEYFGGVKDGKSVLLSEILKSENFHLLLCAILWQFTKPSLTKILPYGVYSFLNITSYLTVDAFPGNQLSVALLPLKTYSEPLLLLGAAWAELLIFGSLARESWEGESVFYFYFYLFLWGLRTDSSEATRTAFHNVVDMFDWLLLNRLCPPAIRQSWLSFKRPLYALIPLEVQDLSAAEELEMELADASSAADQSGLTVEAAGKDYRVN